MYSRVFCVRTIMQRMAAQQPRRGVGSVSATEFMATIRTKPRQEYHVVDVREKYELDLASLKEVDVVELPLSESAKWGPAISEKLDANRTIFCLCHHGVRSMRMAEFLESAGFADVVNISGGIHAVATEADSSIGTY